MRPGPNKRLDARHLAVLTIVLVVAGLLAIIVAVLTGLAFVAALLVLLAGGLLRLLAVLLIILIVLSHFLILSSCDAWGRLWRDAQPCKLFHINH